MPRGSRKALAICIVFGLCVAILFAISSTPRKLDRTVVSFIVKRGTKIGAIARSLETEDLVRSQYLFMLCALVMHRGRVVAGEYELSKSMSIREIARKMARGERKVYTLCIVEGYNLYTMSDVIQKAGIMDGQAFLQLARKPEFLAKIGVPSGSLEGYLFPDTYFFSNETDVDEFLERIVQRTFRFFERDDFKTQMEKFHMNMFQVLSLASIVEKEAKLEREKATISAVFHNRLRLDMPLDADPTVIYGRGTFTKELTKSDLLTNTPYNTYRQKGLPKGPICNPSRSSIVAALYPEDTDVLYFVSKNDGTHVFSKTIEEHSRYVMIYQRNKGRKQ
jgi:UPF0755 protein